MDLEGRKRFIINTAFTVIVMLLIYFTVRFALAYMFPFIIGLSLAFLMQKPSKKISQKIKIDSGVCASVLVGISFLLILALLSALIYGLFYALGIFGDNLSAVTAHFQTLFSGFEGKIEQYMKKMPEAYRGNISGIGGDLVNETIKKFANFISSIAGRFIKSLPNFMVFNVVTIVASLYIAKDYDRIICFFKNLISKRRIKNIAIIKGILIGSVLKIMAGYFALAIISFSLSFAVLWLMRVKGFWIWAIAIGTVDLLPVFGVGTVLLPWSLINFLADKPTRGVLLILLYLIITVVRGFAEPHIIGDKLGISPLIMLVSIFVGLRFAGFLGMLFVPICVIVVYKFYKREMQLEADNRP